MLPRVTVFPDLWSGVRPQMPSTTLAFRASAACLGVAVLLLCVAGMPRTAHALGGPQMTTATHRAALATRPRALEEPQTVSASHLIALVLLLAGGLAIRRPRYRIRDAGA